jgi:hypothetical protein
VLKRHHLNITFEVGQELTKEDILAISETFGARQRETGGAGKSCQDPKLELF